MSIWFCYVRYGEDNTVQDGRVVFDHGSRNPDGNERIGITRRSDPPLRAGTYFVSIIGPQYGRRRRGHAHSDRGDGRRGLSP